MGRDERLGGPITRRPTPDPPYHATHKHDRGRIATMDLVIDPGRLSSSGD